jgi:hypothetical protein
MLIAIKAKNENTKFFKDCSMNIEIDKIIFLLSVNYRLFSIQD